MKTSLDIDNATVRQSLALTEIHPSTVILPGIVAAVKTALKVLAMVAMTIKPVVERLILGN